MKISVINGPNINMLGVREPDLYGKADYAALVGSIERAAADLGVCLLYTSPSPRDS